MKYYNDFDFYNMTSDDVNGKFLHHFKSFKQTKDNTCGPCCLKMVLDFFGEDKSEEELTVLAKTRPYPFGTKLGDMRDALTELGYDTLSSIDMKRDEEGLCFSDYFAFRDFVLKNLEEGHPIIVENIDWGGHYRVIIGLDVCDDNPEKDVLILTDPYDSYFNGGYNYCLAVKFYYMWFDDHCIENEYRKQAFICIKGKK